MTRNVLTNFHVVLFFNVVFKLKYCARPSETIIITIINIYVNLY
jgi:hypothetical protein